MRRRWAIRRQLCEVRPVYEWLGESLMRDKLFADARSVLEDAVERFPADTRFARSLALVLAIQWLFNLHRAGAVVRGRDKDLQVARAFADRYSRRMRPIRRSSSSGWNFSRRNHDDGLVQGYTQGMKTAVSIPDEVFEKAERLARRGGRSRSDVFSSALREYVARHAPDEVTDVMDRVCAAAGEESDGFIATAARRVLERTKW